VRTETYLAVICVNPWLKIQLFSRSAAHAGDQMRHGDAEADQAEENHDE
jgi:hypothetical protein